MLIKSRYLPDDVHQRRPPRTDTELGLPDGDRLLVITDDGSWKVKRIGNTPAVTIAKCGVLGKPKSEPIEAVAPVVPKSETQRVYNAGSSGIDTTPVVLRALDRARRHRQATEATWYGYGDPSRIRRSR